MIPTCRRFYVYGCIRKSGLHHVVRKLLNIYFATAILVEQPKDFLQLFIRQAKACHHHQPLQLPDVKIAILVAID